MFGELLVVIMNWDELDATIGVHSNTLGERTIDLHQMLMDEQSESKKCSPF